jgi:hypothetical protein
MIGGLPSIFLILKEPTNPLAAMHSTVGVIKYVKILFIYDAKHVGWNLF